MDRRLLPSQVDLLHHEIAIRAPPEGVYQPVLGETQSHVILVRLQVAAGQVRHVLGAAVPDVDAAQRVGAALEDKVAVEARAGGLCGDVDAVLVALGYVVDAMVFCGREDGGVELE